MKIKNQKSNIKMTLLQKYKNAVIPACFKREYSVFLQKNISPIEDFGDDSFFFPKTFARASSGKYLILFFTLTFLFFNFSSAHAWKVPLDVSTTSDTGKKVYNKLVVGIEQGATDGFDNLWDTPSLVSDPNQDSQVLLKAYLNNENEVRDDMKRLWKDIRGPVPNGSTTTWDISIDSVPAGKSVVINWDIPEGLLGKGERLMLKDNDMIDAGNNPVQMDMTQVSSYTFEAGETGTRSLSLSLSRSKSHHSKSSSGLGCGTIKSYHNNFRDGNGNIVSVILLLLPVILVRLKRLTRVRLSI